MIAELLESVASTSHLAADTRKIFSEMAEIARKKTDHRRVSAAALDFRRRFDQLDEQRRKFFRPTKEPQLVESWRRIWNILVEFCTNRSIAEAAAKSVDLALFQLCHCRTTPPPLYLSGEEIVDATTQRRTTAAPLPDPPSNNIPPLDPLPGCFVDRYDSQVAFTMVRAKKWIRRKGGDHAEKAKEILQLMAPNTRVATGDQRRFQWHHKVGRTAIEFVRSIDRRAMARFSPATYGPRSMRVLLKGLRDDASLLAELERLVSGLDDSD